MLHTLKWFTSRIKKRIFRDKYGCGCKHCDDVAENGLVVANKQHADYLYTIQNDYAAEGIKLNYRDKK